MSDSAKKIGIYWVHDGHVVGLSCPLDQAEAGIPGLLDSPFTHVDAWPSLKAQNRLPAHIEYDELPRGRVMYQLDRKKWVVYGDGALLGCSSRQELTATSSAVRRAIAELFGFEPTDAIWRHDPHYTVGKRRIDRLLDF